MNYKSGHAFIPFLLVDGILILGLIVLLQLDWVVHHTLYDYNLVFSLNWAIPYWTFIRIVFGSILVAIIAITVLGYFSYRQAKSRSMMPVYVCSTCGSSWMGVLAEVEAKVGEKVSKFGLVKSCPQCNRDLLAGYHIATRA
ncbi:MAG: hypothetical protein QW717_05645 [Candidatus Bathyarchaeia archaeon]